MAKFNCWKFGDASTGENYTSNQATIWRWREAFQHDFAARMDWTVKDVNHANHNPEVVVNGSGDLQLLFIKTKVGETVHLSAKGSRDPDGGALSYQWILYPEATSAISSQIDIKQVQGVRGEKYLSAPQVLSLIRSSGVETEVKVIHPGSEHVILAVTDNGSLSLTRYRRIVINAE